MVEIQNSCELFLFIATKRHQLGKAATQPVPGCGHETSGAEIGHQQLRRASWTADGELSFRAWWTVDRLIALLELDATRTRGPPPQLCALIRKSGFDGDSLANAACVDPSSVSFSFKTGTPTDTEVAERATVQ